jgi:hypothetical protein
MLEEEEEEEEDNDDDADADDNLRFDVSRPHGMF